MKIGRAIAAGVVGGVVVIVLLSLVSRTTSIDADLCALFGLMLTGDHGVMAWMVGCVSQLVVAIVAALIYALIFEHVTRRAGALIGLAIAIPHVILAGLAMGFLPALNSASIGYVHPGAFLEYHGLMAMTAFIVAHLLYGATVGTTYGRPRHVVQRSVPRWRDVTDPAHE